MNEDKKATELARRIVDALRSHHGAPDRITEAKVVYDVLTSESKVSPPTWPVVRSCGHRVNENRPADGFEEWVTRLESTPCGRCGQRLDQLRRAERRLAAINKRKADA